MQISDKFTALQDAATYSVGLLANPASGDFELVEWAEVPFPPERLGAYLARGLGFAGVIGVVEGIARTALDTPLEGPIVTAILEAFAQRLEQELNASLAANASDVAWLRRLWRMPDTREN